MPTQKIGGYDPANKIVSVSVSGHTGVSAREDIGTLGTVSKRAGGNPTLKQYSIVEVDALQQHDPVEEALARLDAADGFSDEAYDAAVQDVINMAIAADIEAGLMTEEEGRRLFEGRQRWQEMKV